MYSMYLLNDCKECAGALKIIRKTFHHFTLWHQQILKNFANGVDGG